MLPPQVTDALHVVPVQQAEAVEVLHAGVVLPGRPVHGTFGWVRLRVRCPFRVRIYQVAVVAGHIQQQAVFFLLSAQDVVHPGHI